MLIHGLPITAHDEHVDGSLYEGRSLRARRWKVYPFWTMFFLPTYVGPEEFVRRREILSHRVYDVSTKGEEGKNCYGFQSQSSAL